jgi:DNA-binding CsgD family transcriptional regulator
MVKGRFAQASVVFAEAIPLLRGIGGPLDLALVLVSSGAALNYEGRYREGEGELSEALSLARTLDGETLPAAISARALANLSLSARGYGDLDVATARSEEAYRLCVERQLELAASRSLLDLADIAKDRGDYARAAPLYLTSIQHIGERGELRLVAYGLAGIAGAATAWGQTRSALLLFGAAAALRERIGFDMSLPVDTRSIGHDLARLYALAGEREADALLREGRMLSLPDASAVAATVVPPGGESPQVSEGVLGELTPRQREVLRLLALSHTDREIAQALYLSPRTVNGHVRAILTKLGARSRRDAIARFRDKALTS